MVRPEMINVNWPGREQHLLLGISFFFKSPQIVNRATVIFLL